ncbi:urease accessory protein UreF [Paraburkholderia fungorum]|uniref:Urease accessory protein UreF n=1 Tax=Paraburkholderia fungorum TaxID=134537 RepID=A0AAP5QI76_9BURK|nr:MULTISPECIES: urease accessory UreF family protein [Paraburkholderia]MDR8399464.1 urease accessory protein UreF [Paraburkholderia sp. USG1]MDT8843579.1 urease accessory protein UreF [Paraburkholderia fungorum]
MVTITITLMVPITKGSEAVRATALLALMQLSDAALPIGRHAHAMGLEALLHDRRVTTPASLRQMIVSALMRGAARADGAATALAHDAHQARDAKALSELDARLDLLKLTKPAQDASRRCGSRLAALVPLLGADAVLLHYVGEVAERRTPGHLAVVSGAVAAGAGIGRADAVLVEMRGIAAMILSAAVRLDIVPATASQGMLAELAPAIIAATEVALGTGPDDMECSAAAGLEIAAMRHARNEGRLFAT